jgi:hypothetical protein
MAIVYSYPLATPESQDLLLGIEKPLVGGEEQPKTRTYTIGSIVGLATTSSAESASSIYAPKASPTFTGVVTSPSFVKSGGLVTQYLMANGSTSTTPTLQQITDAGAITNDTVAINKAEGDQALIITGDNVTNGLLQITTIDGACIKASANDGDTVLINNTNGTAIIATSEEGTGIVGSSVEGDGIIATATGFGGLALAVGGAARGITVFNGGMLIQGVVHDDTGYQLSLSANSAAKPSTNTWTVTSDERVKTNINQYTKGLETILAINPVTYDYNGKAGFDSTSIGNIGIIAQDVLNVIPESINTYQALLNEDDEEKTELYNFDSHALTFILINAVKQLSAEIELLKSK